MHFSTYKKSHAYKGYLCTQIQTKKLEGWFVQCNEIGGIIAGNTNSNPTSSEIESEIRQAILSAFNVKVLEKVPEKTPFTFEYSGNPTIA